MRLCFPSGQLVGYGGFTYSILPGYSASFYLSFSVFSGFFAGFKQENKLFPKALKDASVARCAVMMRVTNGDRHRTSCLAV